MNDRILSGPDHQDDLDFSTPTSIHEKHGFRVGQPVRALTDIFEIKAGSICIITEMHASDDDSWSIEIWRPDQISLIIVDVNNPGIPIEPIGIEVDEIDGDFLTRDMFESAEFYTRVAEQNGNEAGSEAQIGNLMDLFSVAFSLLTPSNKARLLMSPEVQTLLKEADVLASNEES